MSKKRNAAPAPGIKPPGKVLSKSAHGLPKPPGSLTPLDRLRAVLKLSRGVPEQTVLAEAAERMERLEQKGALSLAD